MSETIAIAVSILCGVALSSLIAVSAEEFGILPSRALATTLIVAGSAVSIVQFARIAGVLRV